MKLTYCWYNAFVIEGEGKTIIMDPGQDLHWRRLNSLIPHQLWERADLILVIHGDEDHAEYAPQVARASDAPIVCGPALAERWRRKGLTVVSVAPDETVKANGIPIRGVPTQHGGLTFTLLDRTFTFRPGRVGLGTVGFLFTLEGKSLLNLGDTLLLEEAWRGVRPDVLMVPIGGMMTMDVEAALQAVEVITPQMVIPVHHNWDILFYHRPADVDGFVARARELGCEPVPLARGQTLEV
jgi:L-ascorbate metabolism protein UlaG (beta-lactamase superfamily)